MKKIKVIVVPEDDYFAKRAAYQEEIYINKKLGNPLLKKHNAKYAAPYWLNKDKRGVRRVYHIIDVFDDGQSTVLKLGNSFLLDEAWDNMGNVRKFEYHSLEKFNFVEVKDGLLTKYQF